MYNRIAEAQELLSITPENLSAQVENAFEQEFGGHALPTPDRLADAQQEYDCYILYFVSASTTRKNNPCTIPNFFGSSLALALSRNPHNTRAFLLIRAFLGLGLILKLNRPF